MPVVQLQSGSMPPRNAQQRQAKPQRTSVDMPESWNKLQQRLKRLWLATSLPQSILGIWMYCQMQSATLLAKAKSSFNRMMVLKQTFCRQVSGMFSTEVQPVVEKVLHYLLILCGFATILIIVGFFSAVRWTN